MIVPRPFSATPGSLAGLAGSPAWLSSLVIQKFFQICLSMNGLVLWHKLRTCLVAKSQLELCWVKKTNNRLPLAPKKGTVLLVPILNLMDLKQF